LGRLSIPGVLDRRNGEGQDSTTVSGCLSG
jgi:hypothetical protein